MYEGNFRNRILGITARDTDADVGCSEVPAGKSHCHEPMELSVIEVWRVVTLLCGSCLYTFIV